MRIKVLEIGAMSTNCYVVSNEETKEAVVIDPGYGGRDIAKGLLADDLKCTAILLTHGHFDHIMGVNELREATGAKVYAYSGEDELLHDSRMNCSGMIRKEYVVEPDRLLVDGECLTVAGISFKLIATPGHTRGSVCYYVPEEKSLFSGDTLFCEGIGRTDLPTGNGHLIIESIRDSLMTLPEDTHVYPGHGAGTTIGYEKRNNSYLEGSDIFE